MTRRRFLIVLLALLPLVPAFPASAQDLNVTAGKLDLANLDGIQAAVSRSYATDIETLVERATSDSPEDAPDAPFLMLALVAEFDTSDHAEKAADRMQDRLLAHLAVASTGMTLDVTGIPAFGDLAWQFTGSRAAADGPLAIDGYVVQENRWVTLTIAIGTGDSTADAARSLADYTLVARIGMDDVHYDVSGQSQGGLWDKLPGGEDASTDALFGTQPIYDNRIVPPAPPDAEG